MQSVIAIVLVLGVLIFFHELGHFIVARLFKIGVPVFSLGFGPKLFSFVSGGTEYRLSAVPLGGYVKLAGESAQEDLPSDIPPESSFSLRPPWQRILVVGAGPVFNFVLAIFIYWGLFWYHGQQELLPVVGQVQENSAAEAAELQSGDRVLTINGQEIQYWRHLSDRIQESEGQAMHLTVLRDDQVVQLTAEPQVATRQNIFGEDIRVAMLGITAAGETQSIAMGPGTALIAGAEQTWEIVTLTVQGIIKLVGRIIPADNIGGPILIAQLVSEQAAEGLTNLLALTALISINLGLLNLLPVPVLDGGHILFYTIETITGKPLNPRAQEIAYKFGLAFLIALMTFAVFNDITRFFK
ncbi:site-2 protease. Metallo peptidase. MEROPS family M50B [Desulfonatronum thiosulfatophilum]|uniref:Zinc metalloprotease n=1 Tax=Desulfonatronum thiosulfatophilum TaxID=617002 RepID=A0A1G6C7B9_9BACT|nr:RIP metalloprotease RseP [Desulfonatronum thiosulfatophilum]SDB28790.1 site-2 protease. Metallo peptidase. MEROPS family M50B [Desulfonatronum thiosulfatophilum]